MQKFGPLRNIFIFGSALVLLTVLSLAFNKRSAEPSGLVQAKVWSTTFILEVANTPKLRSTGLMNRTALAPDKGMLFIFDREGLYNFWMKDTLIPLDMLWLDSKYKIVHIEKNVQPCEEAKTPNCPTYGSGNAAKYVVELNAGTAEKYGAKLGDVFEITDID